MAELQLHVHGMDCADEAALVRRALAAVPGLSRIEFDLINGLVRVTFDAARTTANDIESAVRHTGLPAHGVALPADTDHDLTHAHAVGRIDSSRLTVIAMTLFAAGWAIDALAADNWLEIFVSHAHDWKASLAYGLAAGIALWPMWPRAIAAVRHLRLDMHALVCVTVIGAAVIGEWSEGAAVAVLFALAHQMEAWSLQRARSEIAAVTGRGPAVVTHGMPRAAEVERWIERFAAIYTPVVTGAAVVVATVPPILAGGEWGVWFYRALVFLVLACPCALVISTPVTMIAAVTAAARHGVLVQGSATLERAADAVAATPQAFADAGLTIARARDGALSAADVVITARDDHAIEFLVHHARRALGVVRQNVAIALLTKGAFLLSAVLGTAPLWMAVLADTGATVLVTLNGMRMLHVKGRQRGR